jgi:hypothetical protein
LNYPIHTPSGKVYQANVAGDELMDSTNTPVWGEHEDAVHISRALDHVPDGVSLKLSHGLPGVSPQQIDDHIKKYETDTNNSHLLYSAIKHENASRETLDRLSTHSDGNIRIHVAQHGKASDAALYRLAHDRSTFVRDSAHSNKNLSPAHIEELYNKGHITESLIRNPSAPDSVLDHASKDPRTARFVVEHPRANATHLRNAYDAGASFAAEHDNAPDDIVHHFLSQPITYRNQYSVQRILQKKNFTDKHIDTILKNPVVDQKWIYTQVANHDKLTHAQAHELLDNHTPNLEYTALYNLAKNPVTDSGLLDRIIDTTSNRKNNFSIVNGIMKSDALTPKHVKTMLNSGKHDGVLDNLVDKAIDRGLDDDLKHTILHQTHPEVKSRHVAVLADSNYVQPHELQHLVDHPTVVVRNIARAKLNN